MIIKHLFVWETDIEKEMETENHSASLCLCLCLRVFRIMSLFLICLCMFVWLSDCICVMGQILSVIHVWIERYRSVWRRLGRNTANLCMYAHMRMWICKHVCMCMFLCLYICLYVCLYAYVCMRVFNDTQTYPNLQACTHTYTYTGIYIYMYI